MAPLGRESLALIARKFTQTMHIMGNALINEQIRHADVAIRMNLHTMIGKDNSHERLVAAGYAAAMREWPAFGPKLP